MFDKEDDTRLCTVDNNDLSAIIPKGKMRHSVQFQKAHQLPEQINVRSDDFTVAHYPRVFMSFSNYVCVYVYLKTYRGR